MRHSAVDVSVILPFRDDEERLGAAVQRLASHLRETQISFEIIAVDAGSGDNSQALLGIARRSIPELQVLFASRPALAIAEAADRATGRAVAVIAPDVAERFALSPLGRAIRRTLRREVDLVVVEQRFAVCRRSPSLELLRATRGDLSWRRLVRGAARRGLRAESMTLGGTRLTPWERLVSNWMPVSLGAR
jgi:glycosyltransferase involved in cell wall biosynthesis